MVDADQAPRQPTASDEHWPVSEPYRRHESEVASSPGSTIVCWRQPLFGQNLGDLTPFVCHGDVPLHRGAAGPRT